MLNMEILLDIRYHDNATTFTDLKIDLGQPASGSSSVTLKTADYIYVGYYKPFQFLYMDITTPNTTASTVSYEFWNGTTWTSLSTVDDTGNLTRSGMVQWEEQSTWDETTVDTKEQYWIRASTDTLHSAATFNFMGLVFSDANDLALHTPYINESNQLNGETTHFKAHIAARDTIIQRFINRGYIKTNAAGTRTAITGWDLLDINEVRMASTYLTLSIIHFNLSDDAEDHWMDKAARFRGEYEKTINQVRLTVDSDDDGTTDAGENQARFKSVSLYR